jgi:hypothetical protein
MRGHDCYIIQEELCPRKYTLPSVFSEGIVLPVFMTI